MFSEPVDLVAKGAVNKLKFLRENPVGYFFASLMAGMFIGFGVLLAFSVSGALEGAAFGKILMGASFGVALSLVITAGGELFTGNNFVLAVGTLKKDLCCTDLIKAWIFCYVGNWIGGIVLAMLFSQTGLYEGAMGIAVSKAALAKTQIPFIALVIRGILCNILVCLAVFCSIRLKSESGKLIMVFWCLYAFFTSGFEHSVANMTLLTLELLQETSSISLYGYFYNIFGATIGNMIGGVVFVALPYYLMGRKKSECNQKTPDFETWES
ncbi:formate/nitrite transporter family protein [Peptoniphilus sp. KCTC 25270]|uniref:formate/nitrite transporter family protein n=1 Tax=Peptoniphilus sp. KCTC 25270 TaxID=2897414 RepID=UPI001E5B1E96|nr:formate/nitrite transporter family protein [Peptoniphilus sp. KCTC 25270]MCD1147696.1 formate/nitrite transporter family protein [Peptoniphilus sp. KCTC 25270]